VDADAVRRDDREEELKPGALRTQPNRADIHLIGGCPPWSRLVTYSEALSVALIGSRTAGGLLG
jgi:hypothetical protein